MTTSATPEQINPATQIEKIALYLTLLIVSILVVCGTLKSLSYLQNEQTKILSTKFIPPEGFDYSVLPPFLYQDFDTKKIFIKGALTEENEKKILSFISDLCLNKKNECVDFLTVKSTLTLIISESEKSKNKLSELIYIIALYGGALGSLLRLFIDFVGNASYKNSLDFKRWWPLYFTRPVTGAILGLIIIILLKSNIISLTLDASHPDSLWWLGLSIISGFGTIDATERLRLTSKAIFGESKK